MPRSRLEACLKVMVMSLTWDLVNRVSRHRFSASYVFSIINVDEQIEGGWGGVRVGERQWQNTSPLECGSSYSSVR